LQDNGVEAQFGRAAQNGEQLGLLLICGQAGL
jgi:hypothetical protein